MVIGIVMLTNRIDKAKVVVEYLRLIGVRPRL
jgi:hypothetical protein